MAQIAVCEDSYVVKQDGSLSCDSWIIQEYDPNVLKSFFTTYEEMGSFTAAILLCMTIVIGYRIIHKIFFK